MDWLDKLKGSRRADNWPSTFATMDEFEIGGFNMGSVLMNGHYTVGEQYYSVFLEKAFKTLGAAEAFLQRLESDSKVQIRYNPENPAQYEPTDPDTAVNHP